MVNYFNFCHIVLSLTGQQFNAFADSFQFVYYQILKKKFTELEVVAGNGVLDGDALDGLSAKLGKCEERLTAVEDSSKKVRSEIWIEDFSSLDRREETLTPFSHSLKSATPWQVHVQRPGRYTCHYIDRKGEGRPSVREYTDSG